MYRCEVFIDRTKPEPEPISEEQWGIILHSLSVCAKKYSVTPKLSKRRKVGRSPKSGVGNA